MQIERGGKWYRLIFFCGGKTAVVCRGFEKETNRTPKKEIETALERKRIFEKRMAMIPKTPLHPGSSKAETK
ncbi:MAG: type II toxin-antitoxin system RelE/ParE family toxin [Thermodesulfobacteriota bacterium]